jgi:hypothetical protein
MFEREPNRRISRAFEIGRRLVGNTIKNREKLTIYANKAAKIRATEPIREMASNLFTDMPRGGTFTYSHDINQGESVILPTSRFDLEIRREFKDDSHIHIIKRDMIDDGLIDQYTMGIDLYIPDGSGLFVRTRQVHYFNKPNGSLVPKNLHYEGPPVARDFVEPDRIDFLDNKPEELNIHQIVALETLVSEAIAENQ